MKYINKIIISADEVYHYEWLNSNVKSIELINYENKDAIELFEQSDSVKPFDFSKMYVIDTMPEEQKSSFLFDFSKIELLMVWRHLDSPKGKSVKINYNDGSFDIICYEVQFSCQYDIDGNVIQLIGGGGGNQMKELVERSFEQTAE